MRRAEGESHDEEGTVSIIRRGPRYQVATLPNNHMIGSASRVRALTRTHLRALLHHLGIEETTIMQACSDVRKGGMAVLRLVVLRSTCRRLSSCRMACLNLSFEDRMREFQGK
jgi:hypothetical protein